MFPGTGKHRRLAGQYAFHGAQAAIYGRSLTDVPKSTTGPSRLLVGRLTKLLCIRMDHHCSSRRLAQSRADRVLPAADVPRDLLIALPGQYRFGVTPMTMTAMLATFAFSASYYAAPAHGEAVERRPDVIGVLSDLVRNRGEVRSTVLNRSSGCFKADAPGARPGSSISSRPRARRGRRTGASPVQGRRLDGEAWPEQFW